MTIEYCDIIIQIISFIKPDKDYINYMMVSKLWKEALLIYPIEIKIDDFEQFKETEPNNWIFVLNTKQNLNALPSTIKRIKILNITNSHVDFSTLEIRSEFTEQILLDECSVEGFEDLASFKKLKTFSMYKCTDRTRRQFEGLKFLTSKLQILEINESFISSYRFLEHMANFEHLRLVATNVFMLPINLLNQLKSLILNGCSTRFLFGGYSKLELWFIIKKPAEEESEEVVAAKKESENHKIPDQMIPARIDDEVHVVFFLTIEQFHYLLFNRC